MVKNKFKSKSNHGSFRFSVDCVSPYEFQFLVNALEKLPGTMFLSGICVQK